MKGHVRKRGSKWCFVIDVGRDENGKRIQKWFSGFDTKRAAEKAMAAKLQEINSGTYMPPTKETVEAFLRAWLKDKQAQVRPSTFRTYEWLTRMHIIPNIGHIELEDLRPPHLQTFYRRLQEQDKPLSNRTILHVHLLLHEALDRAVKWGMVARNVADAVDPPRPEIKRTKVWTPEQAQKFLSVAQTNEPRFYIAFALAILTGMRKSEILALRWADIDWDNAVLYVNQTVTWTKQGPIFHEPKTDRSRRAVALSPETIEALRRHRVLQAGERLLYGPAYQDNGFVLARMDGRPLYPRTLDNAWYRTLEAADVPKIRFHDLRHTHASLLLAQGVHPKIVSERLGHSTINITLDTYSHVLPGLQREVADRFDDLLFRKTGRN
ncbi:site-specific integrase [Alicyclobacillus shizuokensis]|uniref:site-specific integrase n=1 Tax=Alicyclobacillus shizuokensis TaxID=392014 RepID=UPI00082F8460|nr:site-specific integrase [Alicyclobacillus shizuokensis]